MIGNERVAYQAIQSEKQRVDDIIRRRHEQLIVHSSAVEEVNRRYHDLKHMLLGIEGMQGADEIKTYVRSLHTGIHVFEDYCATGNETMDVVLTDKARLCRDRNIGFLPIINSQGWEEVSPVGISTIFVNALDNAIVAADKIGRDDMRRVTVRVGRVNQMLVARFENYYAHELRGEPPNLQTTKASPQGHGYGMWSIRNVVEQLEGELDMTARDGRFVLTVLIPAP
jgi:sensor histidine kinase regulating citrate/malate metabolism